VVVADLPLVTESASPLIAMVVVLPMATVMTVVADLLLVTENASPSIVMAADLPLGIVMTVVVAPPLVIESASLLIVKVVLILMCRKERENPLPSLTALTSSKIPVPEARKRIEILSSGLMTRKRRVTTNRYPIQYREVPGLPAWDLFHD